MKRFILFSVVILLFSIFACACSHSILPTDEQTTLPLKSKNPQTTASEMQEPEEDTVLITDEKSLERFTKDREIVQFTVSDTPNARLFNAFGCEWDPHYFRPFNTASGCDEESWQTIRSRIQKLGLQKVRMMILPGWYEPQNDNGDPSVTDMDAFTFDSTEFQSVLRSLDVCEELGIEVNFTVWGVNLGVPPTMDWLAYPDCGDWISAPTDHDEFAENVSALIRYIKQVRPYSCVKELTLYNEPDWAYKGSGGNVSFDDYAKLVRVVDTRLRADGVRDSIKLILSDDTDTTGSGGVNSGCWFERCLRELDDIADGYNTHVYAFHNTSLYRNMYQWASARNQVFDRYVNSEKQYTHNEFGSDLQTGPLYQKDIDTYERGLFLSRMAQATLNAGSSGMLYWVLHDVRYNDYPNRSDSVMNLGLFAYADEGWRVRPIYHAWGLVMNHTTPGSQVFAVEGKNTYVSAASLKSPDGAWTYLVTNNADKDCVVSLQNTDLSAAGFNVYLYTKDTVTESDDFPPSVGKTYTKDGITYLYLPACSFAVLDSAQS